MGAFGIPLPPDVAGQMPQMSQFAGQAASAFSPAPQGQGLDATAQMAGGGAESFLTVSLTEIADKLAQVAQIVMQVRPELVPLIQKMAQAGSELQSSLVAPETPQQGGGVPNPPQPEGPQDVSMA